MRCTVPRRNRSYRATVIEPEQMALGSGGFQLTAQQRSSTMPTARASALMSTFGLRYPIFCAGMGVPRPQLYWGWSNFALFACAQYSCRVHKRPRTRGLARRENFQLRTRVTYRDHRQAL